MTEPTSQSTAVATVEKKGISALIHHAEHRLTPLLPNGVTLERVEQEVYFAAQKNPEIIQCTPATIVQSVGRILGWGLTIGDNAFLVPFNVNTGTKDEPKWEKHCTPIAGYQGLAQLMVASKAVRAIEGEAVYAGDEFYYELGLNAHLRHKPVSKGQRGDITHAYVILRLPMGQSTFKVMPIEDIDAIRLSKSKQWKNGKCPPWYAVKTVLRQIAKTMPKDPRLTKAFAALEDDERAEEELTDISDLVEDTSHVE